MKKTNKIGILTFQKTVNYGAQLQNFSLQSFLKKNNKYIETINYINSSINDIEKPKSLFKQKGLKNVIKFFKCHKFHVKKWKKFEEFREKNISLSKELFPCNINKINDEYDKIIVGSDQVWNTEITKNDYTYFLNMITDNNKKLSYAASFGFSDIPASEKPKVFKYLKEFEYLNVREKTGLEIIKDINHKNKNVVLDPTFLLTKEEYVKELDLKEDTKKKYIFVYMYDESKENIEFLYDLSRSNNSEILFVRDGFKEIKNVKSIRDASPKEFLELLMNSQYVVTGSFHGVCLSLIFNKQFYYHLNKTHNRNSRIVDLLSLVGLESRNDYNNKKRIDYDEVNKKLKKEIEKSKKILLNMLK